MVSGNKGTYKLLFVPSFSAIGTPVMPVSGSIGKVKTCYLICVFKHGQIHSTVKSTEAFQKIDVLQKKKKKKSFYFNCGGAICRNKTIIHN